MAHTKPAKAAAPSSGLEDGNQDAASSASRPKRVKKIDAAKAALREGIEGPQAAVAYIAEHYGIAMNPQHFSSIKCILKKQQRPVNHSLAAAGRNETARDAGAFEGYLTSPSKKSMRSAAGEADLIAAMETMKPLVAALGAEKVKRIVDLLG